MIDRTTLDLRRADVMRFILGQPPQPRALPAAGETGRGRTDRAAGWPGRIGSLRDHPALIPTIAAWHWGEWGTTAAEGDVAARIARLRTRLRDDRPPAMFVALDGERPLGTSALIEHDMATHPELSPWLSNVYVTAAARGRGIGRALVCHAMGRARAFGCRQLYLYTHTARGLYERLGWRAVGEEPYEGHRVTVMRVDLTAAGAAGPRRGWRG